MERPRQTVKTQWWKLTSEPTGRVICPKCKLHTCFHPSAILTDEPPFLVDCFHEECKALIELDGFPPMPTPTKIGGNLP